MPKPSLRLNFAHNLSSPILRLVVALVTVPIYIHHVGEARYGVVTIVWVLLGYFGFLDLGLSRAATNALAKLRDAPQPERARVLLTTMALNLAFGLIGSLLLFFVGGFLLEHVVSIPEELKPEVSKSLPWIACLFTLMLVSGACLGALESRERFLLANVFQMFGMTTSQVIPVIMAVFVSPSLTVIIPSAVIAQAATMLALLVCVSWLEGPFSIRTFDPAEARTLLHYGGWVTVTAVINPILVTADQFLVGSLLGVAAITHYGVPMNLVVRTQTLPSAFSRTFFPRLSSLSRDAAHELSTRALRALGYGYVGVCAPGVILAPLFLRLWIGHDFALIAAPVAQILFLGAWINGLSLLAYTLIQSQGRPDVTGRLHLLELLPFLGILWLLTTNFGLNGAATAWTLRCIIDGIAMFWAAGLSAKTVISTVARPGALLIGSGLVASFIGFAVVPALVTAFLVCLIAIALAYVYSEDARQLLTIALARARGFGEGLVRRMKPAQSA